MKLTLSLISAAFIALIVAGIGHFSFEATYAAVLGCGAVAGKMPIKGVLNTFVVPPITDIGMRFSNRRTRFGFACYKDDASDGEAKKAQLLAEIETKMTEKLSTRMTKEQVESLVNDKLPDFKGFDVGTLRALVDDKTGILTKFTDLASKVTELEQRSKKETEPVTIKQVVTEWHKKNEGDINTIIKDKTKRDLPPINIRAVASPMTVATVNSGSSLYVPKTFVEAGINDYLKPPLTLWDTIRKGRTNAETYVWLNKTNPQGAAAFIGPGVLKPGISFSIVSEVSHAKKIAVSAKSVTELLRDIDGMVDMIEDELRWQLFKELNSKLMTGTASSTVPAGIQTLATTYTLTGLSTPNPNYMDALRAAVAQLRSGLLQGRIVIFINPVDAAQMDLAKATDSGIYLLPPFVTSDGRRIAGAQIIEDYNTTQGSFLAALIDYYQVKIYEDYNVSQGWENDDFTRNQITWVGEMRLHQFFNTMNTGAFIYDTFANVIDALTPAP